MAGLIVTLLAIGINVRPVLSAALSPLDLVLAAGLPVVATAAFAALPVLATWLWKEGSRWAAVAVMVTALLCGVVSLSNVIGASMGHRLAAASEASSGGENAAAARATILRAEAEIAALGATRPVVLLDAEIAAVFTRTPGLADCTPRPNWHPTRVQRRACIEIGELQVERARAQRTGELRVEVEGAWAVAGTKQPVGNADAVAVVMLAKRFGLSWDAETVDLTKSVLLAFMVEAVAAVLFLASERAWSVGHRGGTNGYHVPSVPALRVPAPPTPPESALEAANSASGGDIEIERSEGCVPAPRAQDAPEGHAGSNDDAEAAVVSALVSRGGSLVASQRTMADTFGLSRSTVNRVLHDMASRGLLVVIATRRGTAVTLAQKQSVA